MPPPVPLVTRRDILEQEERPVPKQPAVVPARPQRSLETIAHRLRQARATGQRAEAERFEDEIYRKLATDYACAPMPSNAQEKYEMLLDVMKVFQARDWTNLPEYAALRPEYE